jgi:hypothetical protein
MNLENIDICRIMQDSKNVFNYFESRNFEKIEKFKKEKLKFYSEKHKIDYKEILRIYQDGIDDGIRIVKNEIRERNYISSEAAMYYLFEIATIYNIHAKYSGEKNKYYFRPHLVTKHNPEIINAIGRIIGEYENAWQQVLKNHAVFEPLFKVKVDKIKNDSFNRPAYPCHNVKVIGLPDAMQKVKDFRQTLIRLNETLIAKTPELEKNDFNNLALTRLFGYYLIPDFREQCYEFLQETTNNMNNSIYKNYLRNYQALEIDLNICLNTLQTLKDKGIFSLDMSSFFEFHLYRENWFILINEELELTKISYSYITETDETSSINKIVKTICENCVEINNHPEDYKIKKEEGDQYDRERENRRTSHISHKFNDKLKPYFFSISQYRIGLSGSGENPGMVDLAITFGNELIIGEALNFSDLNSKKLGEQVIKHLKKLTGNYNQSKMDILLFLVYFEGNKDYYKSFENYLKMFNKKYPGTEITEITKDFSKNSSVVKIAQSNHSYSNDNKNQFTIYHFYIDFSNSGNTSNSVQNNNVETLDSVEEVRIIKEALK